MTHSAVNAGTTSADFHMIHVFKPHTQEISSISISADGKFLASCSTDSTVFLFQIIKNTTEGTKGGFSHKTITVHPIGFVKLPTAVEYVGFSPDNHLKDYEVPSNARVLPPKFDDDEDRVFDKEQSGDVSGARLLAVGKDGRLFSMISPTIHDVDTSYSFEIEPEVAQLKVWSLKQNDRQVEGIKNAAIADLKHIRDVKRAQEKEANKDKEVEETDDTGNELTINEDDYKQSWKVTALKYLQGGHLILGVINRHGVAELRAARFDRPKRSR